MSRQERIDKEMTTCAAFALKRVRDLKGSIDGSDKRWQVMDDLEGDLVWLTHQLEQMETVNDFCDHARKYNTVRPPAYLAPQIRQLTMPIEAA